MRWHFWTFFWIQLWSNFDRNDQKQHERYLRVCSPSTYIIKQPDLTLVLLIVFVIFCFVDDFPSAHKLRIKSRFVVLIFFKTRIFTHFYYFFLCIYWFWHTILLWCTFFLKCLLLICTFSYKMSKSMRFWLTDWQGNLNSNLRKSMRFGRTDWLTRKLSLPHSHYVIVHFVLQPTKAENNRDYTLPCGYQNQVCTWSATPT